MKYLCCFCVFITIALSAFCLISCKEKGADEDIDILSNLKGEYAVGVKYGDFEGKGKMIISDEHISFLNETERSPLFGMKSVLDENKNYHVTFGGMEWSSRETAPLLLKVLNSIQNLDDGFLLSESKTSLNGIACKKLVYKVEDVSLEIHLDQNKNFKKIQCIDPRIPFEINF